MLKIEKRRKKASLTTQECCVLPWKDPRNHSQQYLKHVFEEGKAFRLIEDFGVTLYRSHDAPQDCPDSVIWFSKYYDIAKKFTALMDMQLDMPLDLPALSCGVSS